MIVKMIRYDFVLYSGEHERFLERLQELGLVDVTVTGWEPSEADLRLIADAEAKTKAVEALRTKLSEEDFKAGEPYATGEEAFAAYAAATTEAAALRGEIARYAKSAEELLPWGEFSAATIAKMAEQGVVLRYYSCNTNAYKENVAAWSEKYTVAEISEQSGVTYFVVVATPEAEIEIDAEEVKAPTMNYREAEALVAEKTAALAATDEVVARAATTIEKVEAEAAEAREKLHLAKVVASGEKVADDKLVVMEGWAEEETAEKVDAMLEEYPNMIYLKRKPTEEDETPVKLKNNRFARLFELIGGMYALPKYGTLDLT
ncbi:MAG: V-type ATP synthase subunit I, partial [Rikenellaceae bacterium]|nr:V-type ATP synthase subunit I [Rikenellaceae bacterium]